MNLALPPMATRPPNRHGSPRRERVPVPGRLPGLPSSVAWPWRAPGEPGGGEAAWSGGGQGGAPARSERSPGVRSVGIRGRRVAVGSHSSHLSRRGPSVPSLAYFRAPGAFSLSSIQLIFFLRKGKLLHLQISLEHLPVSRAEGRRAGFCVLAEPARKALSIPPPCWPRRRRLVSFLLSRRPHALATCPARVLWPRALGWLVPGESRANGKGKRAEGRVFSN